MHKIKTTETEGSIAILIPKEVSGNCGISAGDEIDLSEADGAVISRSTQESARSREIADATEKVFDRQIRRKLRFERRRRVGVGSECGRKSFLP